ncbi:MAG: hypothetical protein ACK5RC_02290 [Curvibacter sp.]
MLGRVGSYLNPDRPADSSGNPQFVSGASFNFGYTKVSGNYPAIRACSHYLLERERGA